MLVIIGMRKASEKNFRIVPIVPTTTFDLNFFHPISHLFTDFSSVEWNKTNKISPSLIV